MTRHHVPDDDGTAARPKRHRWRWIAGLLVAAGLFGFFGVPYIYIHFINKPEKALSFEELDKQRAVSDSTVGGGATTLVEAAGGSDVSGSWKVVAPSTAGYRVKEVLNGQSADGVGRTSSVEGTVEINGSTITDASLSVDLTTVTSDQVRRDAQFQGRIMNTAEFPVALFDLTEPIELGTLPAEGTEVSVTANGTLSLHGVDKPVAIAMKARRRGAAIEVSGSYPLVFADFGIDNPGVGGFVTTEDNGILEFLVTLARS